MKNKIKDLYNIDAKALIKYTDKVYKIKNDNEDEYCLKYIDCPCSNSLIEKINALHLNDNFEMPIKTCIRSNHVMHNDKYFYVSKWIEDDLIESKDLKLKYYLSKLSKLHKETSYTLNVTSSYFNEISMKIEEDIENVNQYYEKIVSFIEKKEYKSPFQWYFIEQYKNIVESLNKAKFYLDKFKSVSKDKLVIRQAIGHLNFSYDHIFISKDKIIGNDKLKQVPIVYDLKSLFDNIEFGSIDLSLILENYFKTIEVSEYEIYWLFSLLYQFKILEFTSDDLNNIKMLNQLLFKYKSINELEEKIVKKNSTL